MECVDHESSCLDSLLRPSMMRPNASMTSPQYRFTLESVNAARSDGAKTPMANRIRPTMAKKKPVGTLRSSILGEPEIKEQSQGAESDGQRYRTLVPAYSLVVFQFGETVHQAGQLRLRLRLGQQADHDGHHRTSRKGHNGDPEILRHCGGERMQRGDPAALGFGHRASVSQAGRH